MLHQLSGDGPGGGWGGEETDSIDISCCTSDRYQKLWKSYVKLRHLLANSPKVKQMDKQKLMQREVGERRRSCLTWRFMSILPLLHQRDLFGSLL